MCLESRYRCRAFYFFFLMLLCGLQQNHSTQKNASLAIGAVDNTVASPPQKGSEGRGKLKEQASSVITSQIPLSFVSRSLRAAGG